MTSDDTPAVQAEATNEERCVANPLADGAVYHYDIEVRPADQWARDEEFASASSGGAGTRWMIADTLRQTADLLDIGRPFGPSSPPARPTTVSLLAGEIERRARGDIAPGGPEDLAEAMTRWAAILRESVGGAGEAEAGDAIEGDEATCLSCQATVGTSLAWVLDEHTWSIEDGPGSENPPTLCGGSEVAAHYVLVATPSMQPSPSALRDAFAAEAAYATAPTGRESREGAVAAVGGGERGKTDEQDPSVWWVPSSGDVVRRQYDAHLRMFRLTAMGPGRGAYFGLLRLPSDAVRLTPAPSSASDEPASGGGRS